MNTPLPHSSDDQTAQNVLSRDAACEIVCTHITRLVADSVQHAPPAEISPIALPIYLNAFPKKVITHSNFLTEKTLRKALAFYAQNKQNLRTTIPSGTKVTLFVSPCGASGFPFAENLFDDTLDHNSDSYLAILRSNPNDPNLIAQGYNHLNTPVLKLYPPELLEAGSFIMNFPPSNQNQQNSTAEADYNLLYQNCLAACHKIKNIFFNIQQ